MGNRDGDGSDREVGCADIDQLGAGDPQAEQHDAAAQQRPGVGAVGPERADTMVAAMSALSEDRRAAASIAASLTVAEFIRRVGWASCTSGGRR